MRSLDQFYKYIEEREKALREQQLPPAPLPPDVLPHSNGNGTAADVESLLPPVRRDGARRKKAPKPTIPTLPPAARYILRNGVTIAVEAEHDDAAVAELLPAVEPALLTLPLPLADTALTLSGASLSTDDAAALWRRLPRHIQLLVGMTDSQEEVAQKYYTRGFKESRRQLIERLLDPTLTLEDTARVLGVTPTTVRRYTNRGALPHHRTVGQQRRFRLSDVLAFMEVQQKKKGGLASLDNEPGDDTDDDE